MAISPGSRRRIYEIDPSQGNAHKFVDPHSPWQKKIEEARAEKEISLRKLGEMAKVSPATLYNWLRSTRGGPSRTYYTTSVNERIANALRLDPKELAEAYNQSQQRPLDPDQPDPAPRAPAPPSSKGLPAGNPDALKRFMATLHAMGAASYSIAQLEQVASMILDPVKPLDPPASKGKPA